MKTEIACEKCNKLYATVDYKPGHQLLNVLSEGLNVRPIDKNTAALICKCGHETMISMALILPTKR